MQQIENSIRKIYYTILCNCKLTYTSTREYGDDGISYTLKTKLFASAISL